MARPYLLSVLSGLAALLLVLRVLPAIQRYLRIRRALLQLPGPPVESFFRGTLRELVKERGKELENAHRLFNQYASKSNGVFPMFMGPVPMLTVINPEIVKIILGSSKHATKSFVYRNLFPWLGTGLLTSDGAKWKSRRRMITPAFHFDILKRFLEVMNEQAEVLISKLNQSAEAKEQVEVFEKMTLCALDIICETAMGKKVHAQQQKPGVKNEYVEAVYDLSRLIVDRGKNPWYLSDLIYSFSEGGKRHKQALSVVHNVARQVIKERRQLLADEQAKFGDGESGSKTRPAFLDILLKAEADGKPLEDEDIREEVDTFMFEGHDTTSASLAWTVQLLGLHPEVQERAQREVDEVMGDSKDLTYEMLGELRYLDMVLKESLRVCPSVPFLGRKLTEDVVINGVNIPEGTSVNISIYLLLRHPQYWENPEKFDPERWTQGAEEKDPYLYIPFSAGARNCIGQKFAQNEEKVIIAKILKNFNITSVNKEIRAFPELILRPEAVWVNLTKRTPQ